MNLKKFFIGVVLVGVVSLATSVTSMAMKPCPMDLFSNKTDHVRRDPIVYDEVCNELRLRTIESNGTRILAPEYQRISVEERIKIGEKLYEVALECKDEGKAFYYFKAAAWEGNVDALVATGYCYEEKKGTSRDLFKALRYFEKAKEKGRVSVQEDIDRVRHKLSSAAGDVVIRLPEDCYDGSKGTTSDLLVDLYICNRRVSMDLENFNIHIEELDVSDCDVEVAHEERECKSDEKDVSDKLVSTDMESYRTRLVDPEIYASYVDDDVDMNLSESQTKDLDY